MRISVVIPTHDRAALLPRALDSVLAQSRPADEILVVDDGSRDDTAELVARRYPMVRLLRQPQRGVSAARNHGIAAAQGDWIALLDSDDAWRADKLAQQCQLAAEAPECPLIHNDEIWIRNGRRVNPMKKHAKRGGWIYRHCLPLCVISPSAALIRRAELLALGGFDENLPACEDYDLWLRLCARHPVAYLPEPLTIKHGGHADQLSRAHWGMDRFRVRALERALREYPLSAEDRAATRAMLVKKARILAQGAEKRGHNERAARYQRLIRQWTDETAQSC